MGDNLALALWADKIKERNQEYRSDMMKLLEDVVGSTEYDDIIRAEIFKSVSCILNNQYDLSRMLKMLEIQLHSLDKWISTQCGLTRDALETHSSSILSKLGVRFDALSDELKVVKLELEMYQSVLGG